MASKTKSRLMTDGSIIKHLSAFVLPVIAANLLTSLYTVADTVVVGHWAGDFALASVGVCATVTGLFYSMFFGIGVGVSVVVSKHFGSKDKEGLECSVHVSYALSIVLGIILAALGFIFAPLILNAVGVNPDESPEIFDGSLLYLRIIFFGTVPNLIYNFCSAVLRAVGDSRNPLIFLIVSSITNVVLNVIFVAGFGFGVEGVAIATVIAQVISAILSTVVLMRAEEGFKLTLKRIRLVKDEVISILKVGLPTGAQSSLFAISNIIILSFITPFGDLAISGNSAASSISDFLFYITGSFNAAVTTFIAQNKGAKKYDRVMKGTYICSAMSAGATIILGAVMIIFAEPLTSIFTTNPIAIDAAVTKIQILASTTFIYAIFDVFAATIKGCGCAFVTMLISIFGVCVTRILWMFIMLPSHNDLVMCYYAYPVSYAASLIAIVFYFYKFKKSWLYGA